MMEETISITSVGFLLASMRQQGKWKVQVAFFIDLEVALIMNILKSALVDFTYCPIFQCTRMSKTLGYFCPRMH